MVVVEIFASIQGEGAFLGTPVIFIRLAGCNLQCSFCDTDFSHGTAMSIDDICTKLQEWPQLKTVVITGGEPTIHSQFKDLCATLQQKGYRVNIETNGTTDIDHQYVNWITCSPKALGNYQCNPQADEIKLVVTPEFNPEDPAIEFLAARHVPIWLQPEGSQMQAMWKKCMDIALKDPRYRVGVQLHKLMEVR